jgi:Co/Zn/Cd efflux system component
LHRHRISRFVIFFFPSLLLDPGFSIQVSGLFSEGAKGHERKASDILGVTGGKKSKKDGKKENNNNTNQTRSILSVSFVKKGERESENGVRERSGS